jgi:hypothetical protein
MSSTDQFLTQAEFELSGVLTSYPYQTDIIFDTSGGSGTGDVSFVLEHETFGIISIDNNTLTENISGGNYTVIATKFGDINYNDISATQSFTVQKINQGLSPSIVFYELLSGTVQLIITGGFDSVDPIITTTSDFITIDGNVLTYTKPVIVTLHVTKPGNENYFDISGDFRFEIVKSMDHLRNTLHTRPRDLFNDPNITTNDILNYYTVEELLDNNITNVLVPDPMNGFSVRELLDMGIGACTIYNTGKIRLIDLQRAGYKVKVCLH